MTTQGSTKKLLFTAYLWNMLGKLVVRSLGIISTLILVRLLEPADFGIVAIGLMIVGFFEVLTHTGFNRYLILLDDPKDDDYNSVWTLSILLKSIVLLLLTLCAPALAQSFNNIDLTFVIYFICGTQFIGSFRNIGMIQFEKNMNFAPLNRVLIVAKLCAFTVAIYTAYQFENYFALLIGTLVNVIFNVAGSYKVSTYRPRLRFKFEREMFSFSKFILMRSVLGYTRSQLDILLVGKRFGEATTGQFSIARQFSTLPQTELISPAMEPLFSGLVKFKSEPEKLKVNALQILQLCYLLVIPCAFGMLFIAKPFTEVVLGEKWVSVADYIGLLSFLMIIFVTQPILNTVYDSMGKIKYSTLPDIIGISLLVSAFYSFEMQDINHFAQTRIVIAILTFIVLVFSAYFFTKISITKIIELLILPVACSMIMFMSLLEIENLLHGYTSIIQMITFSVFGAIIYTLALLILVLIASKLPITFQCEQLLQFLPKKLKTYK